MGQKVTRIRFLTEDQKFFNYLWITHLFGVVCPVHVNWNTGFLYEGNIFNNDSENIKCCIFYFGWDPDVWILYADVSEHTVCSIFIGGVSRKNNQKPSQAKPSKAKQSQAKLSQAQVLTGAEIYAKRKGTSPSLLALLGSVTDT